MPELDLNELQLSPEQRDALERVRQQEGLQTIEQAAEWLIKQRLRSASLQLTGRNRALYPVRNRGR